MPKLLSWSEARKIATKMCQEYGLPKPQLFEKHVGYTVRSYVKVCVRRYYSGMFMMSSCDEFSFEQDNLEDALTKLGTELNFRYSKRALIADQFRSKYAMNEADELLDKELRK